VACQTLTEVTEHKYGEEPTWQLELWQLSAVSICWGRLKDYQGPVCLVSPCGDIRPLRGVVAAQRLLRSQKKQTITHMKQRMALAGRCGDMAGKMGGNSTSE